MPKTHINCPNCRQPITADVNQLFDAGSDPRAKQLILSGAFNLALCPHCGYQGNLATPLVYHDPDKELLLTYFPPELGLPVNEQERIIGPILTQVMNNLPQEKRKAYLLRPQTMLTLQGLVERVLEADGITKEMLQEQQKRLALLQRLLDASDEVIAESVKTDDQLMDSSFFTLLGRLAEASMSAGDQDSAQRLSQLQEKLLSATTFGKQYKAQSAEFEQAVKSLQEIGDGLTREKLLELLVDAPSETRLSVLVSLTRPGIDYEFFQLLSQRIEQAGEDRRQDLVQLRDKLLEITRSIDQAVETRLNQARSNLQKVLLANNPSEALQQNMAAVDDFFVQAMSEELEKARKAGDLALIDKLRQLDALLQQASQPSKEVQLIQELLSLETESDLLVKLEEHMEEITPEFMEALGALAAQIESGEDKDLADHMGFLYRTALRFSMRMNLTG